MASTMNWDRDEAEAGVPIGPDEGKDKTKARGGACSIPSYVRTYVSSFDGHQKVL